MNSDQKLVATLGFVLILLVVFGVYKTNLKAILFGPSGTSSSTSASSLPTNTVQNPTTVIM